MNDVDERDLSAPTRGPGFLRANRRALLAAAVIASLLLLALFIRHSQHKHAASAASRAGGGQDGPVAVSVAAATVGDIQLRIPALGTVTPFASATVRPQVSGVLQKILFAEGQMVHQGDSLAQIDARPYEAALQQAQGNLRRDQALLNDAQLNLKRYEGLVKEDSIAQQQLDTQRALVAQYKGTMESDQAQVTTAQVNLRYTRVIAPLSGRVGLRQVDQGNTVTPGDANGIVVINQLQPISIIFSIPQDHVTAVTRRPHDGAALGVEAYDRTNSAKLAEGKLLSVDNAIDVATGTIKLRARFENTDGSLFPNQFVNIQLLQELLRDQIIVPNAAVRRGAPDGAVSTFVYVVNLGHTVSVRAVMLGALDGERVAVTTGLKAGEVVVTAGGDRLRDGAKVLSATAGASAPGAASSGVTTPRVATPRAGTHAKPAH